jgi:hypothetical protein
MHPQRADQPVDRSHIALAAPATIQQDLNACVKQPPQLHRWIDYAAILRRMTKVATTGPGLRLKHSIAQAGRAEVRINVTVDMLVNAKREPNIVFAQLIDLTHMCSNW